MSEGAKGRSRTGFAALLGLALGSGAAHAADEIQVYNAEINKPGQWSIEQHLNYAFIGRKEPDFPGGLIPDRSLNGTPELAYGVNDWYEIGFYAPFAVDKYGDFYGNGFKFRHLFAVPNAADRDFFYGVNFEFSYLMPKFAETRYGIEIRPIVGWRKNDWELIFNPIVDIGIGEQGETEFAPAMRIARNFGKDLALGVEYYTDFGPFRNFLPIDDQQHSIFGVVDFKVGRFDVDLGLGYGATSGSDKLIAKLIVGTELNGGDDSSHRTTTLRNPSKRY